MVDSNAVGGLEFAKDHEPQGNSRKDGTTIVAAGEISSPDPETGRSPPIWRRALGVIWDSADGDPKNRRYVRKLDSFLFSYICLGYFIKYLDQTNYSNAFVSGMQEDLSLYGNERNWLVTYFNLGIIIGTIPSQMIQLKYIRPSYWIPACEFAWSVLVIGMAGAKNIQTLYVLRFFVGLLEACSFPGYSSLLGGWYGPRELTKRVAIFEQTSAVAAMFSGYLQAALYEGMNGRYGLAGWRWLFIMDGIISVPIAIWGIFAIPDLPHTTKAFYWSDEDKRYGVERIEKLGRGAPRKLTWQVIKSVYSNWRLWVFIWPYLSVAVSGSGTNYFNLWLKASGYSVVQTNVLPTAGNAISLVSAFTFGAIADSTGLKLEMVVLIQILVLVSNILLSVWYIPTGALLFAFYLSYAGSATQPIIIAWGHELNGADPNLRQLLVATGNVFTYTSSMVLPLVLFPTYDAPHYKYGYQIISMFGVLAMLGTAALKWQSKRDGRTQRLSRDVEASTNTAGSDDEGGLAGEGGGDETESHAETSGIAK